MRVFVTGATGFIGSAVVPELLNAGHQVLGLARSDHAARALAAAGAAAHPGALDDLDSLRRGAAAADGVIHLAFNHDFILGNTSYAAAAATDQRAIEALGAALAGSDRPLVVTSGLAPLSAPSPLFAEDDRPAPTFRFSEAAAAAAAGQGVRALAVRLPQVHGPGDRYGFVPTMIGLARQKGVSPYIGEGRNRWAAVHRLDAARLFRLALEQGAPDGRYHGVADQGVPLRELAEAIGRHLNVPVVSQSPEEAAAHFGWLAGMVAFDLAASSVLTQQRLGWQPSHPGLLTDLEQGHYFGR